MQARNGTRPGARARRGRPRRHRRSDPGRRHRVARALVLILVIRRLLNYVVAGYLIVVGALWIAAALD
ncbi:MAG: DUF3096 domain-containing protein [Thermoleophilia bacterium]|nr:DUF3096 domain-containing protein [Thermoleophilia bacterium]